MQSIATFLRKWRKEHGYTQQQMADFLVVHRTTYTKYETGVVQPSLDTFYLIVKILGVDPMELLE